MTAADIDELEMDRAALAALRQVMAAAGRESPQFSPLAHAFAVMSVRVSSAEQAMRREGRTA